LEADAAKPAKIIVIEDEPIISWQIELIASELGHNVLGIATTRDQALKMMDGQAPDIVLADVRLADGSSGVDAVSKKLRNSCIPVIFVTADPDRLLANNVEEPPFVVSKPFLPATLKAIIRHALFLASAPGEP
jgi:DNA-binding response OmpR family regulator